MAISDAESQIELTLQKVTKKCDFHHAFKQKAGYAGLIQDGKTER
jgi:hypothetical protein